MSCPCPQFTKQFDNISTKMFQAKMIKTAGKYTYKYSNSRTDNINKIILSQDYKTNKIILFQLSLLGYSKYYAPLARQYRLGNVLTSILNDLTPEEKDIIFPNLTPVIPVPVQKIENIEYYVIPTPDPSIESKTYYVISRTVGIFSYFIFKNYSSGEFIVPGKTYIFDYSDPSNSEKNTLLRFSYNRGGPEISSEYFKNDEDEKIITITLPLDTSYNEIFPYDENQQLMYWKYYKSGYTVDSFCVSLLEPTTNVFSYNPSTPNFYYVNNISYELLYLTASSVVYLYEYKGPRLTIKDINSKEQLQLLSNRKFGMSLDVSGNPRTYLLYVPQMYKLAILNSGQTGVISYTGDPDKKISERVVGTESDNLYDFYYGTVEITVSGKFLPVSIYTLDCGYLHAKQTLVYAENPDTTFDSNPYRFPY